MTIDGAAASLSSCPHVEHRADRTELRGERDGRLVPAALPQRLSDYRIDFARQRSVRRRSARPLLEPARGRSASRTESRRSTTGLREPGVLACRVSCRARLAVPDPPRQAEPGDLRMAFRRDDDASRR